MRRPDLDGEPPKSGMIVEFDAATGIVKTSDESHHGLGSGDWVKFTLLEGSTELNDGEPRQIDICAVERPQADGSTKPVHGFAFKLRDYRQGDASPYVRGGYFEQVKMPSKVEHAPLLESVVSPKLVSNRWDDPSRPEKLPRF